MLGFIPDELALWVECLFSSPFPDGKTAVLASGRGPSKIFWVRGYRVYKPPSSDICSHLCAVITGPSDPVYLGTLRAPLVVPCSIKNGRHRGPFEYGYLSWVVCHLNSDISRINRCESPIKGQTEEN